MFRDFRSSKLRTLLNNVAPSFFEKSHFGRLHLQSYSFGHYPRLMTIGEDGAKTVLKIEIFAFFDNFRFMTTEYCKARINALACLSGCPVLRLAFRHS